MAGEKRPEHEYNKGKLLKKSRVIKLKSGKMEQGSSSAKGLTVSIKRVQKIGGGEKGEK